MLIHPLPSHGQLKPYGLLVHTTGDGIPRKIINPNTGLTDVFDAVGATVDTYTGMQEGPHYAIVPDGTLIKFRAPDTVAWHAATDAAQRRNFLDGSWEKDLNRIPSDVINWWKMRWPGVKSPQHLFPGPKPNGAYVGVELVPCGHYQRATFVPSLGTPATPKGRYTAQQYAQLALLALALADAYAWPPGWEATGRLAGHEDVNPYTRPGWDPGAYKGWWSWSLFKGILTTLQSSLNIRSRKEIAL